MRVEVFFDYYCPYCYKGHGYLKDLIRYYPRVEIAWKPCESHPRPEKYTPHSDLAIQGMYFMVENGGDIWEYHDCIYKAMFEQHLDIGDIDVLTSCIKGMHCFKMMHGEVSTFKAALKNKTYEKIQQRGNVYAWEVQSLYAVPSYIAGERRLLSRDGILVEKSDLNRFLEECNK